MRLAAQAKAGFYPAASEAVAGILKHLRPSDTRPDDMHILDPCAGEGLAIRQIAEGLGVHEDSTYCVELDKARTDRIRELMPKAGVLGPATFMGVQITGGSYSLAYCNPPFDIELGGGRREEQSFVQRAAHLLVPRGILVLVCPHDTLVGNRQFVTYVDSMFEDIQVYKFPDGCREGSSELIRPYNEIVLFGRKRKAQLPGDMLHTSGCLHKRNFQWRGYSRVESLPALGETQPERWSSGTPSYQRAAEVQTWEVPPGFRPHTFKKTGFTDEEMAEALDTSPLNAHFKDVKPLKLRRPPLPLDKGHLGLILASGMLDGEVHGPHGSHVVRGSSIKVEYHNKEASTSEANAETGAVTTKDVFSERPITVIRCVGEDGVIQTFSNAPPKDIDDGGSCDDL